MVYGISKSKGGDSPANTEKMESCVMSVMKRNKGKKGFQKENAIRICKAGMMKSDHLRTKE